MKDVGDEKFVRMQLFCESAGGSIEACSRPAVAVELVHTYSLIHDDLPCMDDDEELKHQPMENGKKTARRATLEVSTWVTPRVRCKIHEKAILPCESTAWQNAPA